MRSQYITDEHYFVCEHCRSCVTCSVAAGYNDFGETLKGPYAPAHWVLGIFSLLTLGLLLPVWLIYLLAETISLGRQNKVINSRNREIFDTVITVANQHHGWSS